MKPIRPILKLPALGALLAAGVSCNGSQKPTEPSADTIEQALVSTLTCPPGFNAFLGPPPAGALPFVPLASLKSIENPVVPKNATTGAPALRGDLTSYVADLNAAIQLGKAFFWDMQAGSDDKVACATCHFQAGADVRVRNQVNPGANSFFDVLPANSTLSETSFPFVDPQVGRDIDDAAGSQGVRAATFGAISSIGEEIDAPAVDPIFGTRRQVTGVNAPTVVNAAYNHRNFFNGRAQNEYNGSSVWGYRDGSARIYYTDSTGAIYPLAIALTNSALASQAVGPPLNPVEMSASGRTFPDLGTKLLLRKPLGLQSVSPADSVLGGLADTGAKGLATTYTAMIQKAFKPLLWNSARAVTLNGKSYSLTQANFSFFWGIAIMLYEGTLIADDSPMDRYVASRTLDTAGNTISANPALLDAVVDRLGAEGIAIPLADGTTRPVTRQDVLAGLDLFERPIPPPSVPGLPAGFGAGCTGCHLGAETTSASVRNLTVGVEAGDVAFKNAGFDLRMERMFMGVRTPAPIPPLPPPPVPFGTTSVVYDNASYAVTPAGAAAVRVNTYDSGWYDVGVRPIADNPGLGGKDAFGRPLSWTEYYQAALSNPSVKKVAGGGLTCINAAGNPVSPPAGAIGTPFVGEVLDPATNRPIISGGLLKTEPTDVAGSFKTAQLRNVELSGPYFHAGGKATLRQVVEFYDDGGNFPNLTLSPLIRPLALSQDQIAALVAFLVSLTDERVVYQRAPFDHPELVVPAGEDPGGADLMVSIPAVGAAGSATPVARFLGLNPFSR